MKYEHIGWCKDEKTNSDKVWGVICLQEPESWGATGKYVTFWGRRGAKLQTKLWEGRAWDAEDMIEKKLVKGYKRVHKHELDEVYPEFQSDLEKTAFWATFKI
jgi:hypothetical protein